MWTPPKRFNSEVQESAFLADYCGRFVSHRRIAGILGFLIDTIYILWDYLYSAGDPIFAPHLDAVVLNRSITSATVLPVIAIMFSRRFAYDERFATRVLVAIMLVQFALYCRGFLLAPYPYDYMYFFMGMFICQIFGFSMLRLRSRPTIILMTTCLLMAALTFAWNWQIKHDTLTSHSGRIYMWVALSFLISVGIMGVFVCTLLESSERAAFLRTDELAQLNKALELSSQQEQEKAHALIELKERMRQEAEQRNREKSQFLAAAVHDLKQPIQAIGNALEPGRRALDKRDVEKARGMFDLAAAATQLMRDQLAGVLEISRLESGFMHAELTSFDIRPIINNVLSQLATQSQRDGVSLETQLPPEPLIVYGDPHFIDRILLNLASNGIKYHDPAKTDGRWVKITSTVKTDRLCIEVEDNGLGIEEEHIRSEAIFKPFFQANNQRRESEKGVGLGLSIVQAMLALMPKHRLSVHSQVGIGTCMTLELPWSSEAGHVFSEIKATDTTHDQMIHGVTMLRGIYVLYVEDDGLVRASTCALFDAYGILYEEIESLDRLHTTLPEMDRIPDILLTDYRLPAGATAEDVVAATHAAFGPLPVLVVTGEVMATDSIPSEWRLMRKPLSAAQLLLALRAAMEESRQA